MVIASDDLHVFADGIIKAKNLAAYILRHNDRPYGMADSADEGKILSGWSDRIFRTLPAWQDH